MVKFFSRTFIIFMLVLSLFWVIFTIANGISQIADTIASIGIIVIIGMLVHTVKLLNEFVNNT